MIKLQKLKTQILNIDKRIDNKRKKIRVLEDSIVNDLIRSKKKAVEVKRVKDRLQGNNNNKRKRKRKRKRKQKKEEEEDEEDEEKSSNSNDESDETVDYIEFRKRRKRRKRRRIIDQTKCTVCKSNSRNVLYNPCGCVIVCSSCKKQYSFKFCQKCNQKIGSFSVK